MLDPPPRWVVCTRGELGGSWAGETSGAWDATPLAGPAVDAYGCGASIAAALAYGLGAGMELREAIELGACCGAACLCGRGPYAGQLELA
jgi:ribokinase